MGYRILCLRAVLPETVYWEVQKRLVSGESMETADAHVAEMLTLEVGVVKELGFKSIRDLIESARRGRAKAPDGTDGHDEEPAAEVFDTIAPLGGRSGKPDFYDATRPILDEVADACEGSGGKPMGPAEGKIE